MNFIKFLRYDFKHGILRKYWLYLIYSSLVFLAVIQFQGMMRSFEISQYSVGDVFLYIFGGKKEYIPRIGESFELPYLWLVNHIVLLYFGLNYMYKDLQGFGQQTIYRSGGRLTWWFSKCFWNTSFVLLFYVCGYLTIVISSFMNGAGVSLSISGFMSDIMDFGAKGITSGIRDLRFEIVLLPFLFSVSMSVFQMTVSLLSKPVVSFIITSGICIASSYKLSVFLFGNYSMALRCNQVVANGFESSSAILYLTALWAISIGVGACRIRKCDILSKE